MKKYFKTYRRKPNSIFFLVLGCIFVVLGILAIFWTEILALAVVCMVFGVLLAVLPQFVLFEKYGISEDVLHYRKAGLPRKVQVGKIGAVVLCIYDEYRRGKGFCLQNLRRKAGKCIFPRWYFCVRWMKTNWMCAIRERQQGSRSARKRLRMRYWISVFWKNSSNPVFRKGVYFRSDCNSL